MTEATKTREARRWRFVLAVVLLGAAGFLLVRSLKGKEAISEQTFFYDLSEKRLFPASREALPPIRGLSGAQEDAVRAVVIAPANSKERANRRIAYLEKYAPEFKQQLEKVRAGQAEPLPRGQ